MYRSSFGRFGYSMTPWVKRLIIANTLILLAMWMGVIPFMVGVEKLGFDSSQILRQPWTLITYMFVHANFGHLFFNMLALFFFGPALEQSWGGKEFIKYYTICGVGGALLSFAFGSGPIIGASGAVYGVMLAYALNWPDNPIWIWAIFPVKAKYFILFLGALSFFSAFSGPADRVAHFAHLGGLLVGYIYLKKAWALDAHLQGLRRRFRRRKLTVVSGGAGGNGIDRAAQSPDEEARILEVVDLLLDKIAAHGLESLTPEERTFLDDVSRRRQMRH